MKRIIYLLLPVLGVVAFFACKKEYTTVAKTTTAGGVGFAYLKVVHASPNFAKIFKTPADSLNVFVGYEKVNATALKFGNGYPVPTASGNTLGYASIPADNAIIVRVSYCGVINKDSVNVATFTKNLKQGVYYTLVITDSIASATSDSSRIWIQDTYPRPTQGPGYFYLRFMHGVADGLTDTVDLYDPRRNQLLFTKIKRDSTTTFAYFPTTLGTPDTLYVRQTGTANVLAKLNTIQFGDQQFYTSYYVGDTAAAPAAKTRTLLTYQNK